MSLQTFDFNETPVRLLLRDGQPWFVAADVCRVLEIANSRDALASLDADEKAIADADSIRSNVGTADISVPNRGLGIISESGLYALVFKSRKPEAKKFRRWVTGEVLPAIRQTGRYAATAAPVPVECFSVLAWLRQNAQGWELDRQMAYGSKVRHFAKAMGIVTQTGVEPALGAVVVFPRLVLEIVQGAFPAAAALENPEVTDFTQLLHKLAPATGKMSYRADEVRQIAKAEGLFPHIFAAGASTESERSAFGKLCVRFNGCTLGGCSLSITGSDERRRYTVTALNA